MFILRFTQQKGGTIMNQISKEKHTKEKNTITIHKILHKILDAIKILYEICKVSKAIIKLFF